MKKQLTALLVGLSVASLTIAAPVSSVKPASQAKKAPVKKASKKKQKREAKILLRAKPNNKAKIVGRVSVDQQLVPFYKKGDWLKVGDPGNGKVAWFNEKQYQKALENHLSMHESSFSYTITKDSGNPEKIVAYRDGKKLSSKEAKSLVNKEREHMIAYQDEWHSQMESFDKQMNSMMRMNDMMFQAPIIMRPVIVFQEHARPEVHKKPNKTSLNPNEKVLKLKKDQKAKG